MASNSEPKSRSIKFRVFVTKFEPSSIKLVLKWKNGVEKEEGLRRVQRSKGKSTWETEMKKLPHESLDYCFKYKVSEGNRAPDSEQFTDTRSLPDEIRICRSVLKYHSKPLSPPEEWNIIKDELYEMFQQRIQKYNLPSRQCLKSFLTDLEHFWPYRELQGELNDLVEDIGKCIMTCLECYNHYSEIVITLGVLYGCLVEYFPGKVTLDNEVSERLKEVLCKDMNPSDMTRWSIKALKTTCKDVLIVLDDFHWFSILACFPQVFDLRDVTDLREDQTRYSYQNNMVDKYLPEMRKTYGCYPTMLKKILAEVTGSTTHKTQDREVWSPVQLKKVETSHDTLASPEEGQPGTSLQDTSRSEPVCNLVEFNLLIRLDIHLPARELSKVLVCLTSPNGLKSEHMAFKETKQQSGKARWYYATFRSPIPVNVPCSCKYIVETIDLYGNVRTKEYISPTEISSQTHVFDIFQADPLKPSLIDQGGLVYLSLYLLHISDKNKKETFSEIEEAIFHWNKSREFAQTIIVKWINDKMNEYREGNGELRSPQLQYLTVLLGKCIVKLGELDFESVSQENRKSLLKSIKSLHSGEILSTMVVEIELVGEWLLNSIGGSWLDFWFYHCNALSCGTLLDIRKLRIFPDPSFDENSFKQIDVILEAVYQASGAQHNAALLFVEIVHSLPQLNNLNTLLSLVAYDRKPCKRYSDIKGFEGVQTKIRLKYEEFIKGKTNQLGALKPLWTDLKGCGIQEAIAAVCPLVVDMICTYKIRNRSELEDIKELLLDASIWTYGEHSERYMQAFSNIASQEVDYSIILERAKTLTSILLSTDMHIHDLLQKVDRNVLYDLFIKQVESLVNTALDPSYQSPDIALLMYTILKTFHFKFYLDRKEIDDIVLEVAERMHFPTLMKLQSLCQDSTMLEEQKCVSEHIKRRLQILTETGIKSDDRLAIREGVKHFICKEKGKLEVQSETLQSTLESVIDAMDVEIQSKQRIIQDGDISTELEECLLEIFRRGSFWSLVLTATGKYSSALISHLECKNVTLLLKRFITCMECGRVSLRFLRQLRAIQHSQDALKLVNFLPGCEFDDEPSRRLEQKMSDVEAKEKELRDIFSCLNKFSEGFLKHFKDVVDEEDVREFSRELLEKSYELENSSELTYLEVNSSTEYWGSLYAFLLYAKELSNLASCDIFLNVCDFEFRCQYPHITRTSRYSWAHGGAQEFMDVLEKYDSQSTVRHDRKSMPSKSLLCTSLKVLNLAHFLHQYCLPVLRKQWGTLSDARLDRVSLESCQRLIQGIKEKSNLHENIEMINSVCSRVPDIVKEALESVMRLSDYKPRARDLKLVFQNFRIEGEDGDIHRAIQIMETIEKEVPLGQVHKAVQTVSSIEEKLTKDEWKIIAELAKCEELVTFLRPLIDEDFRNLVDAVEERSEQHVNESTVSDLIDVKRYMEPLLRVKPPNQAMQLLDVIVANRSITESLKTKVDIMIGECMNHFHGLKDLYSNIANRGEMTKEIIRNAIQYGVFILASPEPFSCRVTLSYERGNSNAMYGLQELNDYRSRALLMVSSKEQMYHETSTESLRSTITTHDLEQFIDCVEIVNSIQDICFKLFDSGHLDFTDIDEKARSREHLQKIRRDLKTKYTNWKSTLDEARENYYYLNFFHSKQLFILDRFFSNCNEELAEEHLSGLKAAFSFVRKDIYQTDELNELRARYGRTQSGDENLQQRLFYLCEAVGEIFGNKELEPRKINFYHCQQITVETRVQSGIVFIAEAVECKMAISVLLKLYINTTGTLPEANQIVFCHSGTSWEEIYLLLMRCAKAQSNSSGSKLYMIVNVELLPTEEQARLVERVQTLQRSNTEYLLALICCGANCHHVIDQFSPDVVHKIDGLTQNELRDCLRSGSKDILEIEVVTSNRPGMGKTEYVKHAASKLDRGVTTLHISGPITKDGLVDTLKLLNFTGDTILHIDTAPVSDPYLLDTFIFELAVIRMVVSGTKLLPIPNVKIMLEIANTQADIFRNALLVCSLFREERIKWEGFKTYAVSEENNSPEQVVCAYLNALQGSESGLDNVDVVFESKDPCQQRMTDVECRHILETYFESSKMLSFSSINTFLAILGQELRRLSASIFFKTQHMEQMFGQRYKGVRGKIVKALCDVAKDFSAGLKATPVKQNHDSIASLMEDHASSALSAQKMVSRIQGMDNWADDNHLLIVFNRQDFHTVSILYRNLDKVPDDIRQLFERQMDKPLPDYTKLTHDDLQKILERICRNTRQPFQREKLKELSVNYALTVDNLLKMVLIYMRIKAHVPVILMGETGCGKTTLVTYLARVCENIHFEHLNVHAGVTEMEIFNFVDQLRNKAVESKDQEIWAFVDEINTSDHLGLLNDIICHHVCRGKQLPHNLTFIAACNPYKLREESIVSEGLPNSIPPDEISKLVYRVHPLPETMLSYVWDFGSLSEADEELYIKRMLHDIDGSLFQKLVLMSQMFLRKEQKTSYCVSLRDVRRCKHLYRWFKDEMLVKKELVEITDPGFPPELNEKPIRGMLLALCHCYQSRLIKDYTRKKYCQDIATIMATCISGVVKGDHIEKVIEAEQDDILNRMTLPSGTAKNKALKENVFVMLTSILNRIPVFVVGKPGCSKSLSMQLIRSNLRGPDSSDDYFKMLKALFVVSYQGSGRSTSAGIAKVFSKAELYRDHNPNAMPVVLLDEIGLAERSHFNPLKVLHSLLEPEAGGFPKIAVVGISNWELDAAKMNRAVHLARPEPTIDDLAYTAKCIDDYVTNSGRGKVTEANLRGLAEAYYEYHQQELIEHFHGLRDYYCLVKFVTMEVLNSGKDIDMIGEIVETGLLRNFGGQKEEMENIISTFAKKIGFPPNPRLRPDVVSLIQANIGDMNSRHVMLITSGDSAISILEDSLQNDEQVTMYGSMFENDVNSEEYNYRVLSEIILCMERGVVLILKDLDNIYSSLYDMLNQNYTVYGKKRNCRIALGPHSNPMCQVHDNFRCVVLVEQRNVDYKDPPFLNRFEKQILRFTDVLDKTQKDAIDVLGKWIEDISAVDGLQFFPQDMFLGLHSDTLPSLMFLHARKSQSSTRDPVQIAEWCKLYLLNVACPDAVLRVSKSKYYQTNRDGVKVTQKQYFSLPLNQGLEYFLDSKLSEQQDTSKTHDVCSKLVIYTHSNIYTDVRTCINPTFQTHVLELRRIKSERDLTSKVRRFCFDDTADLLILQCTAYSDADNILLSKCRIDQALNKYLKSDRKRRRKHVCIIIHIDRGETNPSDQWRGLECDWQFNFLSGWSQFTVDSLEPTLPNLDAMMGKNVSELLQSGRISMDAIIGDQFLRCFSCLNYVNQTSATGVEHVEGVFQIARRMRQSPVVLDCFCEQILKHIRVRNDQDVDPDALQAERGHLAWQIDVACDRQKLLKSSTLVKAMIEEVKECISIPLTKIIAFMEKENAWTGCPMGPSISEDMEAIENNDHDDAAEIWISCFGDDSIFDILSKSLHEPRGVESCNIDGRRFNFKFPFFKVFFEKIENQQNWLMKNIQPHTCSDDGTTNLAHQLAQLIQTIPVLFSHQYLDDHTDDYFQDVCNMFSAEQAPRMSEESRLKIMRILIEQLKSSEDVSERSTVDWLAELHVLLRQKSELLKAELHLVAIWDQIGNDDIVKVLAELTSANRTSADGHSVETTESFDVKLVSKICRLIMPTKKTIDRLKGPTIWRQKVNLVLLLGGRVTPNSTMLQFLLMCRDFASLVDFNFSVSEKLYRLAEKGVGSADPLKDESIFEYVFFEIKVLMRKEKTESRLHRLEHFLCRFFDFFLFDADTPLLPRILESLRRESGELVRGSRSILSDIIKADLDNTDMDDFINRIIHDGIFNDQDEENCPNLIKIDCILRDEKRTSYLAVACADILRDVAFSDSMIYNSALSEESADHPTLELASKCIDILQEPEKSIRFDLVCAFLRAFSEAIIAFLRSMDIGECMPGGNIYVIAQSINSWIKKDKKGFVKMYMLQHLFGTLALFELREWCENFSKPLPAFTFDWFDHPYSNKLTYNPLSYVEHFESAIKAITNRKENHDEIKTFCKTAEDSKEHRLALFAAVAEIFYWGKTTTTVCRPADKEVANTIIEHVQDFDSTFTFYLERLLGITDFNRSLRISTTTSSKTLQYISVGIHLLSIVVAHGDTTSYFVTLLTNPRKLKTMLMPGLGKPRSILVHEAKSSHVLTECSCGLRFLQKPIKDENHVICPMCDNKHKQMISRVSEEDDDHYRGDQDLEATETVRMLTPLAYRMLNILTHACLLCGLCSEESVNHDELHSVLSEISKLLGDFDTFPTTPDKKTLETYLLDILEQNWTLVKQLARISDEEHEDVTLFCHKMIQKLTPILVSKSVPRTDEERTEFEAHISTTMAQDEFNVLESSRLFRYSCLRKQGFPDNSTEVRLLERIDTATESTLITSRIFRKQNEPTLDDMRASFVNGGRTAYCDYPFLHLVLLEMSTLECIGHLQTLLKWNSIINHRLSKQISQSESREMSIQDFLSTGNRRFHQTEETCKADSDAFKMFSSAFNKVRDNFEILTNAKPTFDPMTEDNFIYACVMDNRNADCPLKHMIGVLQRKQNEFLEKTLYIAVEGSASLSFLVKKSGIAGLYTSPLDRAQGGKQGEIIDFEWDDSLLFFRDINTECGQGHNISYNFLKIERSLALKLVLNKAFLKDGTTYSNFAFSDELFHTCSEILREVADKIKQEPLPRDERQMIFDKQEQRKSFAQDLLDFLELMLVLLKKTEGEPEQSLEKYIERWATQLPGSFPTDLLPDPRDRFKLKHIVNIYEILETILIDNVVSSIHDKFRVKLPKGIENSLSGNLKPLIIPKLENLVVLLKRFIFRFLRKDTNVELDNSLVVVLKRSVGTTMDYSVLERAIPKIAKVCHIIRLLELIEDRIKSAFSKQPKSTRGRSSSQSGQGQRRRKPNREVS